MTKVAEDGAKSPKAVFRLASGVGPEEIKKYVTPPDFPAKDGAIKSNAYSPEDEYQNLYVGAARDKGILEPPYNLRTLDRLSQENNSLSPCIEAMVTNVDGTGYDFASIDEDADDSEDDAKIKALREFFAEPWPGESFVTIREKLRRDIKRTGNGYLEVLRNAQDEITFIRHVDAKMMRLLKLDDPVPVEKIIRRGGRDMKVTVMERQRRFCQLINGITIVYFKEFGVDRDLNKTQGTWAVKGERLPANSRATEIIHFKDLPDAKTPYGVPCWINQLPSILGSRKAEEFNLDFFDNGGVPPVLIVLQGGTLQSETRKALEQKMVLGAATSKNRVQVLEVEPSGGSMDHPAQARVTVERFGGERQSDSMFEKYDDKCEMRIRRAFRLPPIFVGQAADYAFATAYVSYNVAEAQVFKPERDKFDEIITMKLLAAMGYRGYKLKSKPLTIEDVNIKLQGIELAMGTSSISMEDVIYEINEACGTDLKFDEEAHQASQAPMTVDANGNIVPAQQQAPANDDGEDDGKDAKGKPADNAKPKQAPAGPKAGAKGSNGTPVKSPGTKVSKSATQGVIALAQDTLIALRKRNFDELSRNIQLVSSLDPHGREEFHKACASLQFIDPSHDHEGLSELLGCTIAVMQRDHSHAH